MKNGMPTNGRVPWVLVRWAIAFLVWAVSVLFAGGVWVAKVNQGLEKQDQSIAKQDTTNLKLDHLAMIVYDLQAARRDDHEIVTATADRLVAHDRWSRERSHEIETRLEQLEDPRAIRLRTEAAATKELLRRQAEERRKRDQEEEASQNQLLQRLLDRRRP